ncbi:tRNA (adenine-N(1)-)-methyltransferase catalytic subunit trm61 [Recurvomyces mirabilis]|uniref:tRNA (adenine(58)-N(1))-methyltransferase catalytic subunit TRM61 n=1 Tax=Recurvomyces mirabilis TaxID=574656 RepID=A0AAE0WUE4_9PEZI|nr:tRNA (adenine-N(1)-)-methyltransferase catalytic subunit trm61 [Recurvomyces mirabilis]KAK5157559.1 tRNA (adenine-N(1)-)-methyltransferase catalytic subunit trm61 [Recurvomyces mirabilis]
MSPFFETAATAEDGDLAILHLKRDTLTPITLRSTADDGYAEGAVTNTRFGSFPHSTLIGLEWGAQVRASKVDTGTRGRKGKQVRQDGVAVSMEETTTSPGQPAEPVAHLNNKRKSEELEPEARLEHPVPKKLRTASDRVDSTAVQRAAVATVTPLEAGSGFVHLLQPTPESWTSSLDHRTQVVYIPDYSYILQRIRAKPGQSIIEAGAGSGSFTHAAARAVFSGYPGSENPKKRKLGKVYSYEYHEPRVETLRKEINEHGLDDIVHLTHRDVCNDGFLLTTPDRPSPNANAIFLDLPAPWQALRHLTRIPFEEQVIATTTYLRKNGWTEIDMVEVHNRRMDVRREQVGLKNEGLRGVNASAATVDEAVFRLRDVEQKIGDFHASKIDRQLNAQANAAGAGGAVPNGSGRKVQSKADRLDKIKRDAEERKLYKEGNLVHRTETEVKTHTSYLVFATLPRAWNEDDERACAESWDVEAMMRGERSGGETKKA